MRTIRATGREGSWRIAFLLPRSWDRPEVLSAIKEGAATRDCSHQGLHLLFLPCADAFALCCRELALTGRYDGCLIGGAPQERGMAGLVEQTALEHRLPWVVCETAEGLEEAVGSLIDTINVIESVRKSEES